VFDAHDTNSVAVFNSARGGDVVVTASRV